MLDLSPSQAPHVFENPIPDLGRSSGWSCSVRSGCPTRPQRASYHACISMKCGLCVWGRRGRCGDPEWRGFCAGASTAKLQPRSPICLAARLTGLGDPGPLNLPCDTLIVGFQSMLFVYKMQGRGRWRASLSAGSMYWGVWHKPHKRHNSPPSATPPQTPGGNNSYTHLFTNNVICRLLDGWMASSPDDK